MKKIKVSDATDHVLDWMVATALGITSFDRLGTAWVQNPGQPHFTKQFHPSVDWSQGGPIIDRLGASNGLQLITHVTTAGAACGWRASCDHPNGFYFGETALIAAMRCFVASRLGDEVEVPEELLR